VTACRIRNTLERCAVIDRSCIYSRCGLLTGCHAIWGHGGPVVRSLSLGGNGPAPGDSTPQLGLFNSFAFDAAELSSIYTNSTTANRNFSAYPSLTVALSFPVS